MQVPTNKIDFFGLMVHKKQRAEPSRPRPSNIHSIDFKKLELKHSKDEEIRNTKFDMLQIVFRKELGSVG